MATRPTPRYGHSPIQMRRVREDVDKPGYYEGYDALEQAGDFFWQVANGKRSLFVAVPSDHPVGWSGCGWTIDYKNANDAQWSWDGNEDAPTLSPSLHWIGLWHGWVRNGQLVEA